MSAFWRRKVDLPPILGPVTSQRRASSDNTQSLATKRSPLTRRASSTTGCRPASTSKQLWGAKCGRHQPPSAARSASAEATSSQASESAAAANPLALDRAADRKSGVEGKSVAGRGELGGS